MASMQPGAYSSRFKMFQKEQTDQVKKDYQEETAELVARNHRLHVETNRRRKAYAQKKKTQAQREERRRQLILAKRRQMIQDATDKFQRLNRNTQQSQNDSERDVNVGPKYTLDEALRAIMGHNRSSSASIQQQQQPDHDRGPVRRPLSVPADLQSDSRHELKSSRSLFEQQLTQHQQSLLAQQQVALRDFSEAMIGRLQPNGAAKTSDQRQQGTSVIAADSLESTGHQSNGQLTFRINRAAESNPFKSLDRPQESNPRPTNVKNGMEAQRHIAGANSTQDGGDTAPRNLSNHVANAGSTHNIAASCAKETKASDYTGVYPSANGPAPPNAGSPQSKTVINGASTENGSSPGTSVISEAGSTGGLSQHRSINSPNPNVAVVQPNSHTNLQSTNTSSQKPATELKGVLPSTDWNLTTNHSTANAGVKPQTYSQNGENFASGGRQDDVVVGFVPEPTPKGGDPGRFFDINGYADKVSLISREVARGTHPTHPGPPISLDVSSVRYDTKFSDVISVSGKAADSDLRSMSTYPVKTDVPTAQALQYKPPTGRWQLGEASSKSGARPPDIERRVTRDRLATDEGGTTPDTKSISAVEQGFREMDLRPTDNTRQVARPGNSAQQGTSLSEARAQQGTSLSEAKAQQGTSLSDAKAQQGTSLSEAKAQYGDEVYVDETSSNSSASSIRPVSRIPVPIPASGKVPRGILKRRPSSCMSRPDSGQQQAGGLTRSASMTAVSGSLRDSLEVTKQHRRGEGDYNDQKPGKKSVRFAEVLCEEEPDRPGPSGDPGQLTSERVLFYPRPPVQEKPHTEQSLVTRPVRPISARVMSTTPAVDPSIKVPRVASAGVMRRGPFHNPAVPSESSNQPTTIASRPSDHLPVSSVSSPAGKPSSNATAGDARPPSERVARDISGISLDKTPTEEEINWLWEKVRSCLNRETSSVSTGNPHAAPVAATRQVVPVSCTNFDGSSLMGRPPAGEGRINNTYVNNYMGSQYPARRRITMETLNAYTKRTSGSLLQQRRFSQPGTAVNQGCPAPQSSACVPANGVAKSDGNTTTTRVNAINNHVSESMAAFLAAEELTQHVNLDDNLISNVMNAAERRARTLNANPTMATAPSALSIEEDRLMKSIDRLNEKLYGRQK